MRNFGRDLKNIYLFSKNTTASWGYRADHRRSVGSAQINKIKVKTREILISLIPISGKTKQDTRLPPVYFAPFNIAKDVFQKDKNVFFFNILCFSIRFSDFSNFNFFSDFCRKTTKIRWQEIFTKNYHLRRILEKNCHMYRF